MPTLPRPPRVTDSTPPADTLVDVRVIPRSGRSGVAGLREGALLVRLAAAPVDGAANTELIAVLAGALGVSRRAVAIVSGERSRSKRVRIAGFDRPAAIEAVLAALTPRK